MFMISNFLSNFINFFVIARFSWLTLGILFSPAIREALVAKLVILGISTLTSFILTLRLVLVVS